MTPSLAKTLLADRTPGVRILYGVATAVNTVQIAGSTVAVELPALSPVVNGDYVAVLAAGADRLILGKVGGAKYTHSATYVGTTDGSGDLAIPFGFTFASAPIVVAINGDRSAASFAPQVLSKNTTGWTVRCDGAASTTVRVDYIAHGIR